MRNWVAQAVDFTLSLRRFGCGTVQSAEADDPMTHRDIAILQSQIQRPIPASINRFLTLGSASCRCKYVITIQREPNNYVKSNLPPEMALMLSQKHIAGGAFLCNSESLVEWNSPLMAKSMRDSDPLCAKLWSESFLFMEIGNGDFLALHSESGTDDPPVIYLSHEAEVYRPIAPDFKYFLHEWSKINYLEPLDWHEKGFLSHETGYLDSRVGDLSGLLATFS